MVLRLFYHLFFSLESAIIILNLHRPGQIGAARHETGRKDLLMKLLALDGNSILNRAFYGIKLLSTKDGQFTNGIYGFLSMLMKIKEETQPDAVAIAFDLRAPTFRHRAYAEYKAKRKGMPDELAQQMPVLKELLGVLGYRLVECEGFEADDILGTLSRGCEESGNECVIATGDRDSLQLVSERTTVRLVTTKYGASQSTLYDIKKIREEYGVVPKQLIDIKAIQGDSSDNIPGVPGIGPKGAGELIQQYGSLDGVYANLQDSGMRPALCKKLEAGQESARMSLFLGTICREAPVETNPEAYVQAPPDTEQARKLLIRLEMFSLMEKLLPSAAEGEACADPVDVVPARQYADGAAVLARLSDEGTADFLSVFEDGRCVRLLFRIGEEICDVQNDPDFFRAFCKLPVRKRTFDVKPLYRYALSCGNTLEGVCMDSLLAGYLLNPSSSDYQILRMAAGYDIPAPASDTQAYSEAAVLPALAEKQAAEVEQNGQQSLFQEIELPLARVLADMEAAGFAVDADGIAAFGGEIQAETEEIQAEIYRQVGYEFNINSPKQLGDALFVKLGLQHGKKTKSGYSTNAEVLEGLRYEHPVVELVLRYRTLTKLKSTYCDGLLKVIGEDGRIHSSFNQTETRTGRISSTEPNLQNIPVRTKLGREMRRFFSARPGWLLVDADYSQIELRVLAHVADDENMIAAFRQEDDIHRATAAQVFHMPEAMVTPEMRSRAKAVNFGIVYGIGAFSLSKDIGVSRREAEQYIQNYLAHYSGVKSYMETVVRQAKERGYAETIFGRRRYLQELASSNFNLRAFGERVARNMPIQGAAADIIKIAMIRVYDRLRREGMRARLILQVHDELIVEAPEEEAEQAAALLTEEMERAVNLRVPMVAEAKIGKTWYDAKG